MPNEVIAIPVPANGKAELPAPAHLSNEERLGRMASGANNFQILRLIPNDPFCRKLFPAFVERCLAFIDATQADTDPIWLGSILYSNFYQATNFIHCLVAINEKEEIRAHALSLVQTEYKLGTHLHILQIWKSDGDSTLIDKGMELIDEFAKEQKIKTITYSADSLAKLRLYQKFGFQLHRILGKKEL